MKDKWLYVSILQNSQLKIVRKHWNILNKIIDNKYIYI